MDESDMCLSPATELARQLASGARSPVEVVDAHLERIADREPELNAFVTLLEESARADARAVERAIEAGEDRGPLWGLPVAIKDFLLHKEGVRHTYGSRAFADNVADRNSLLVDRIEAAGGVVIGTTNTPEFARKGTTENELVGATGNPFDPDVTPGGSSGGSAAAVAAGMAALAEGSDVAGSIRQPASMCGVYGLMPTPGVVPIDVRPNAFATNTPYFNEGPLARTVADAALLLSVLAGPDPLDPQCVPLGDVDYVAAADPDRAAEVAADLAVASTADLGVFSIERVVRDRFEDALGTVEGIVDRVDEYPVAFGRDFDGLLEAYLTLLGVCSAEFDACFEDAYGVEVLGKDRHLVTDRVAERTERARTVPAVEYTHAEVVRTEVYDAVQAVFEEYDVLLTPTLAVPPFPRGQDGPTDAAHLPIDDSFGWMLTWPFNLSGHPVASIPIGFTEAGLPVGMQVVGDRFAEETVLSFGAAFESERPWIHRYPR